MDKAFEEKAFSMQVGEISEPVQSNFGFHIIKLNDITVEQGKPFDEVREEIREQYAMREAAARFGQMAEEMKNLVYEQPTTLAAAADALGLTVQQSDWFTRTGGADLTANPVFIDAAFTEDVQQEGLNSEVVEIDENTLVAMRLLDHRDPELRSLDEVADGIRAELQQQARMEAASTQADEMLRKLTSGEQTMDQLAADAGLEIETHSEIGRDSRNSQLSPKLLDAVFRAPAANSQGGTAAGKLQLDENSFVIYAVKKVTPGDPANAPAGLDSQMRDILERRKGDGLYTDYERGLREQADIVIYEDRL